MRLGTFLPATAALVLAVACGNSPSPVSPSGLAAGAVPSGSPAATPALDAYFPGGSFDLNFFNAFARNGFASPASLEPLRLLKRAPQIYLRTVDEAGQPIDPVTLDSTEAALNDSAMIWGGERFGLAGITRGTASRQGQPGWITVKWSNPPVIGRCGLSTVGFDGGWMEFNHLGPCGCGGESRVYPRVVRHELGHVFGYYHTDSPRDVMYGQTIARDACDLHPSDRERQYAKYVYAQTN